MIHPRPHRTTALTLAMTLLTPLLLRAPVQARADGERAPAVRAITTKQKVVLLAGAALLYYLYKKHQAKQAMTAASSAPGGQPQLYRSKNGGVYYRDPRTHQAVWLTVPQQPVQIPAGDVQRYAPDYRQYQGRSAPAVPNGYRTQSFAAFDPGAAPMRGPAGPHR